MIKIANVEVIGWEAALRSMRNPLNSWEKSDSRWFLGGTGPKTEEYRFVKTHGDYALYIGQNDQALMKKLCKAGTDHRKFMRMITVYIDITAPLYWWKEFDTYKVGTVANSCSTMHKIADKEFTLEDFSTEHLQGPGIANLKSTINLLNYYRDLFNKTIEHDRIDGLNGDKIKKDWWWQMIQLLPSSYNQKRTVLLNYEVLANMYKSRKSHKLDEWVEFCEWVKKTLPYSELITGEFKEDKDEG